ncbi:DUF2946 family protein [Celeribacter halophilus]|jgi:hypothetical protein|uniref:DUF2946 domain-containing protein n=1 Tax=Celeribacter halophilus TaxID=576117 RepID=A0AAW7XTT5_9RHOB|nr:DUF2946 family protein [Celeribacter halophilus]MBU2891171.1 hypothetical protein [Celeribacter halophilus]MDO6456664.1 hypothetical protein [Celeribacter halophilus]MDO6510942.1 hypothetical protein [Celeribacter halophilus]MDO6723127.1 hypothetical protein [Celeribacter halophilus]
MSVTRTINALVVALLLVVTSQSMAVARGTMRDATGAVVICTGTGPLTVLTDADGQPVGPAHICPDCALSVIAGLAEAFDLLPPAQRVLQVTPLVLNPPVHDTVPPRPRARAPPLV